MLSFQLQLIAGGHYSCYRKLGAGQPFKTDTDYEKFLDREKTMDEEKGWVHVSDEHIRRVSSTEVVNAQAYMLHYEKNC